MAKDGKYVVEHEFLVRARMMDDGTVQFKVKDEDMCYALNVSLGSGQKMSEYDFELGGYEFEHMFWLRRERVALRTLLKDHLKKNRLKIKNIKRDWKKAARIYSDAA